MLQFGTDTARKLLNGAAYFFEASDQTWTGSDFSDTRAPEAQRFYNYLCIAYGGDQQTFKDFVVPTGRQPTSRRPPRPAANGFAAGASNTLVPQRVLQCPIFLRKDRHAARGQRLAAAGDRQGMAALG